jgi:hypothetical protein
MGIVALSNGIDSTEICAANAACETVKDAFFAILDIGTARKSHDSPHFTMSNYQRRN